MPLHANRKSGQGESKRIILAMRYRHLSVANRSLMIFIVMLAAQEERMIALRGAGVRKRIIRIKRKCAFQKHKRFLRLLRHSRIDIGQRPQNKVVGVEAIRPLSFGSLDLSQTKTRLNRADDRQRDLVLQGENIVGFAVIAFGPNMRSRCNIDELRGDAHTISRFANTSFEHVANAKFASDLLYVDRPALVGEGRIARDDEEPLDAR